MKKMKFISLISFIVFPIQYYIIMMCVLAADHLRSEQDKANVHREVLDCNDSYNYVNVRVCIRKAYEIANTRRNASNTSATNTNSTNPDPIEFLFTKQNATQFYLIESENTKIR